MLETKMIYDIYRENSKSNVSAWKFTAKTAAFSLSYSRLDLKNIEKSKKKRNFFKITFSQKCWLSNTFHLS